VPPTICEDETSGTSLVDGTAAAMVTAGIASRAASALMRGMVSDCVESDRKDTRMKEKLLRMGFQ
jgi:hypothetical protein